MTLGSFFVWINVLTFSLHTKDDFTIENQVFKLIHGLIWIFEIGTNFKLWTATKVNLMETDNLWKLISIQYVNPTSSLKGHKIIPCMPYFQFVRENAELVQLLGSHVPTLRTSRPIRLWLLGKFGFLHHYVCHFKLVIQSLKVLKKKRHYLYKN